MPEVLIRLVEEPLYDDSSMVIRLEEYRVVRRTSKGAWVERRPMGQWQPKAEKLRFVLDGDGKRFAYPTVELARESLIRRKERQIEHLKMSLIVARAALKGAQDPAFEPNRVFQDETLAPFHSY
jgi:hypothetical protein